MVEFDKMVWCAQRGIFPEDVAVLGWNIMVHVEVMSIFFRKIAFLAIQMRTFQMRPSPG